MTTPPYYDQLATSFGDPAALSVCNGKRKIKKIVSSALLLKTGNLTIP